MKSKVTASVLVLLFGAFGLFYSVRLDWGKIIVASVLGSAFIIVGISTVNTHFKVTQICIFMSGLVFNLWPLIVVLLRKQEHSSPN